MMTHLLPDEGEHGSLVHLTERQAVLGEDQGVLVLAGRDLGELLHRELLALNIRVDKR
jgi:hypothetical protein